MNAILTIAKRETVSFFDSLMAYVLLVVFLGFSGFFTWIYGSDVFFSGQASLKSFFTSAYWILFLFIPALTMRTISDEKKSGTLELLLTKPITDWQVIFGKYLSVMALVCVALLLTLPYYFSVWVLGPIDHGATIMGYLGLIFMSSALAGIGIFASSMTNNQIIAFIFSLLAGIFFILVFNVISQQIFGSVGIIINYLSMTDHYDSISRGVLDSRDVIYFASVTFLGLFLAGSTLSKRNIID
jgi:ABC-2 type transport system permease protein